MRDASYSTRPWLDARRRTVVSLGLMMVLAWPLCAGAQEAPAATPQAPAAPSEPASAPAAEPVPEPEYEVDVPAMPPADADFSADRDLFIETETDAERHRKEVIAAETKPADDFRPLYQRWPRLTLMTQAIGGLFGSAVIGLLGANIGESINAPEEHAPLGGPHGPLFGGLTGSLIGVVGGVWGSGQLFERDTPIGWTALGAGVGTIVGAGAAAGFAFGMDKGDTATSLAVGSFVLCQVGGTVLFNDLFAPKVKPAAGASPKAPAAPPRGRTGPASSDPDILLFPLAFGEF